MTHHPANLTIVVEGITPVEEVQQVLLKHEQFIPIGPFKDGITIQEAVFHNLIGSHSNKFGTIRNWLLNSTLRTPQGKFTTGADVMKNVSGYDLTRLLIGSEGKLGTIVQATFKLVPISKMEEPTQPIESGFRIITLPGNFEKLYLELKKNDNRIISYQSLGVVDIESLEKTPSMEIKAIQKQLDAKIIQIRNGIPLNDAHDLPKIHRQIFQLFEAEEH